MLDKTYHHIIIYSNIHNLCSFLNRGPKAVHSLLDSQLDAIKMDRTTTPGAFGYLDMRWYLSRCLLALV